MILCLDVLHCPKQKIFASKTFKINFFYVIHHFFKRTFFIFFVIFYLSLSVTSTSYAKIMNRVSNLIHFPKLFVSNSTHVKCVWEGIFLNKYAKRINCVMSAFLRATNSTGVPKHFIREPFMFDTKTDHTSISPSNLTLTNLI